MRRNGCTRKRRRRPGCAQARDDSPSQIRGQYANGVFEAMLHLLRESSVSVCIFIFRWLQTVCETIRCGHDLRFCRRVGWTLGADFADARRLARHGLPPPLATGEGGGGFAVALHQRRLDTHSHGKQNLLQEQYASLADEIVYFWSKSLAAWAYPPALDGHYELLSPYSTISFLSPLTITEGCIST